jgi:uncharacterized membrane-anchored protein YitT (DUF2179 family)
VSLAYWVAYFHPIPELTHDFFLAAAFGGVLVGVGVGLIIRYGGSLDGTEIVAIILDKKSGFSVGGLPPAKTAILFAPMMIGLFTYKQVATDFGNSQPWLLSTDLLKWYTTIYTSIRPNYTSTTSTGENLAPGY